MLHTALEDYMLAISLLRTCKTCSDGRKKVFRSTGKSSSHYGHQTNLFVFVEIEDCIQTSCSREKSNLSASTSLRFKILAPTIIYHSDIDFVFIFIIIVFDHHLAD
jgi:hypothetical protein